MENLFLCMVVVIFFYYIYMSIFVWIFVESLYVYCMLIEVCNIDMGFMWFYYVVGWGILVIVIGLVVGLDF